MVDSASPSEPEWPVDLDGATVTEDLVARLFVAKYKGMLAYCHSRGAWYEFDGSTWVIQDTPQAFQYARQMCRNVSLKTTQISSIQKVRFCAGVETFAKGDPIMARTARSWNQDPWLLGTPSGTIDLKTGELRKARPSDNINKSVAVVPDEYEDCPTWHAFLEQTTGGDEGLQRLLQQIAGYSLTGLVSEQALFFIYGQGGNGKGTFIETITSIAGSYAETAAMETFEARKGSGIPADLAMLDGARLVTAQETEEDSVWAEARIKQMTGGDKITARFMRQNFFTYMPQFTLIIVGNNKPALRTVDEAMRRRFNIIPFTHVPKTRDGRLKEKLQSEWPGILRWMINGALDWQQHGLVRPQVVIDATAEYFDDQNTMEQWIDQSCDVNKNDPYYYEQSSVLFASWARYAKANGIEAGTSKTFKPALQKSGFLFKRDKSGRYFYGIRLKSTGQENDD